MKENNYLDRTTGIPLYYQLKKWLLEEIECGALAEGVQIPTEIELCEKFHLSRGTVRQATHELLTEGKLYMVRGRGTFVAATQKSRWLLSDFVSVAETLTRQGVEFETRVLEVSCKKASAKIATDLQIEKGENLVYVHRVRSWQNEPMIIFKSYLPEKLTAALYQFDLTNQSLYETLEKVCGISVVSVDHTLTARAASAEEARCLEIPEGAPVHDFEELSYDSSGLPVDYSFSIFRGDKSRFRITSKKVILTS